jgi:hypothetical protein
MASRIAAPGPVSLAALAFLAMTASGCAHAAAAGPEPSAAAFEGVLSELPAHPPAGTCYARVKVLADERAAPPPGPRAVWRQTPALPGAVGPTWCLVTEPGLPPPPPPPERFGWVRVLCDTDATPDRIRRIQGRLRAHGEYEGEETGRYDQATADAVARFQQSQHIEHGGYLSLQTVEAIERAEGREAQAAPPAIHVTGCCAAPPAPAPVPYPVEVRVPVPQPYPVYVPRPYPVYVQAPPAPCCAPPPPPVSPCCRGAGGWSAPTYGRDGRGMLTWPGKVPF